MLLYFILHKLTVVVVNFMFSEPCIVIHIHENDQRDAQFFFNLFPNKLSSTCFEQIIVHHQIISVNAAYNIFPCICGMSSC